MKKFELGQVVMTDGVQRHVLNNPAVHEFIKSCINRHQSGDWGVMPQIDKDLNDKMVDDDKKHIGRIMSSYIIDNLKIWVLTEIDRSVTTVMLPEEY